MKITSKVIIVGIAILVVLAIIAVMGAACCACVLFATQENWHVSTGETQVDQSTNTTTLGGADNIVLDVDTIGGDIVILESAVATDVTVTFDTHAPAGRLNDLQTSATSLSVDNNTVRITATARWKQGFSLVGNSGADVTITVPKNASYDLNLHTFGGDIRVPPLHGTSIYLDTLGGKLSLNGGRYDNVYMNTAGGDIVATYEATNATLKTLGGNIDVDTTQTAGTLYANTMGGNIHVALPSSTQFTIDASTLGGHVRHGSIAVTTTTENDWTLVGQTADGPGSLKITLKTLGGNIDINN